MKKFNELTQEQIIKIAVLALEDICNFDILVEIVNRGKKPEIEFLIETENWNTDPPLAVTRVYSHGNGDTYCAIWEVDNDNKIDITVYNNKDVAEVANIVKIVKLLIEWGFV